MDAARRQGGWGWRCHDRSVSGRSGVGRSFSVIALGNKFGQYVVVTTTVVAVVSLLFADVRRFAVVVIHKFIDD